MLILIRYSHLMFFHLLELNTVNSALEIKINKPK